MRNEMGYSDTVDVRAANDLHQRGQLSDAIVAFTEIIKLRPGDPELFCMRGNAFADNGQLEQAVSDYDRAIVLDPRHVDAYDFRGAALAQLNRLDDASASLDRAIMLNRSNANALNNRGNVRLKLGRREDAIQDFRDAISLVPNFAPVYNNLANALFQLSRWEEAMGCYRRTLALDPTLGDPYHNMGRCLLKLGRTGEALENFQKGLAQTPKHPGLLLDRGIQFARMARYEAAVDDFNRVLESRPNTPEAYIQRGAALAGLRRYNDAIVDFSLALIADGENVAVLADMGTALVNLGRLMDALICYDRVLKKAPDHVIARNNRANVLRDLGRFDEAAKDLERVRLDNPDMPYAQGMIFYGDMQLCEWSTFESRAAEIAEGIEKGRPVIAPLPVLAFHEDPETQKKCVENFCADQFRVIRNRSETAPYPKHDRIRVGYFSSEFQDHATMRLFGEVIEAHDRDRFELTAFSFGPACEDEWRRRALGAFERFMDVSGMSDEEIASSARKLEIDVAVDLKGYTRGLRTGIFAQRAAPIQVSYLGYPGTMGAPFIDYLIADEIVIPDVERKHYSERVVFLPGCYQPNCKNVPISAEEYNKKALGLPTNAFVYCCFNQQYKINPRIFQSWMNVLRSVGGSVLWLWVGNPRAQENLVREAEMRGVDGRRLVFAPWLPLDKHLKRVSLADLFLDTAPYGAHTTASDALRMGVPLLTCAGRTFASRVGASLLKALDMEEMITYDLQQCEDAAIKIGLSPGGSVALKRKLQANLTKSDLYDSQKFSNKLERAYLQMYERYQAGLPPDDIRF